MLTYIRGWSSHLSALIVLEGVLVLCGGCTVGPRMIDRDRFDYGHAIAQSQREEVLMNVVRLRYMESPMFMTITSIVNSYGFEGHIEGGSEWGWDNIKSHTENLSTDGSGAALSRSLAGSRPSSNGLNVGTGTSFSVRPTITYAPTVGKHFTESILTPMSPQAVMALIESGWRVDVLFPLVVSSINGIRNRYYGAAHFHALDERFSRTIEIMGRLQDDQTFSMRLLDSDNVSTPSFVLVFSEPTDDDETHRIAELKDILGLDPDIDSYEIVFGAVAKDHTQIAIVTRSILATLSDMASYIRVPESDIAEGITYAGAPMDNTMPHPIVIHSGEALGDYAYVKIKHRGHWFWIDDRDLKSKRTFTFLQLLSAMAESPTSAQTPLITLPAG